MTTLSTVRGAIKAALVIPDTAKDAAIDDCIRSAIRLMQRRRYWFLRTVGSITLVGGASTAALPTDFAAIGSIDIIVDGTRYTNGRGFDLLEYSRLKDTYYRAGTPESGKPKACAIVGNTVYFSHAPTTSLTCPIEYYRRDVTLPTGDSGTSVWFDDGYDVIRSLAQHIYEKEYMQNPDADGSQALGYQTRLDEMHTFYEQGMY